MTPKYFKDMIVIILLAIVWFVFVIFFVKDTQAVNEATEKASMTVTVQEQEINHCAEVLKKAGYFNDKTY